MDAAPWRYKWHLDGWDGIGIRDGQLVMRHFFPMRIDVHIRILAHICNIRSYMRKYLLLAHFPAPARPSLIGMGIGYLLAEVSKGDDIVSKLTIINKRNSKQSFTVTKEASELGSQHPVQAAQSQFLAMQPRSYLVNHDC